ncbi:MAG: hypothetical protein EOM25_14660 [Deltaproteobacteria bacterium]|nr:hypothetical protein [Deltaproteobacteria bacterium]
MNTKTDGSILFVSLVLLVILTLVGIAGSNRGYLEVLIASHERDYKSALYDAEGGIYATPKLISRTVDTSVAPNEADFAGFAYNKPTIDEDDFVNIVMGFTNATANGTAPIALIFQFHDDTQSAEVAVERTGADNIAGGGVEFASGGEGIGTGSAGGVAIMFRETSEGRSDRQSAANIEASYRKVTGVPGGL